MKKDETFELSIKKLEDIVSKLENGEESLEDSLKLFKEGTELAGFCYKVLENAEQKITDLSKVTLKDKLKEAESIDE
jgi:exodeoxyribonuclease VII small subunit